MEKQAIKVYARFKECNPHADRIYHITKKRDCHEVVFKNERDGTSETSLTSLNHSKYKPNFKYRFQEIFDQNTTQTDVFNKIAKPVINSLLDGYNGTIFAYGQTGSGKTYAIRGDEEEHKRGIIPRSIKFIFDHFRTSKLVYSVFISYMEIYNEIGYDLLGGVSTTGNIEELPRVSLYEDGDGKLHLRNLQVVGVATYEEAMELLRKGDGNRKIAETPMNPRSSRSHCVFTIYLSSFKDPSNVARSKLHLVDLAGSERIHKSTLSGTCLKEALHINLSLHFLEQVMLALSESNRSHIPYRNSLMTTVLRDSLGGNCLTTMLATLSSDFNNMCETISTCKFAQRVAMVTTDAMIIHELDPKEEIASLKMEVAELRRQISEQRMYIQSAQELTSDERDSCNKIATAFLENKAPIEELLTKDYRKIVHFFKFFKNIIKTHEGRLKNVKSSDYTLQDLYQYPHENVQVMKSVDEPTSFQRGDACYEDFIPSETNKNISGKNREPSIKSDITQIERDFYTISTSDSDKENICKYAAELRKKYMVAKSTANRIEACKQNIENLTRRLEEPALPTVCRHKYMEQLEMQKRIYKDNRMMLQTIKRDTENLKNLIEEAKSKTFGNKQSTDKEIKNYPKEHDIDTAYRKESENKPFGSLKSAKLTSSKNVSLLAEHQLRDEDESGYFSIVRNVTPCSQMSKPSCQIKVQRKIPSENVQRREIEFQDKPRQNVQEMPVVSRSTSTRENLNVSAPTGNDIYSSGQILNQSTPYQKCNGLNENYGYQNSNSIPYNSQKNQNNEQFSNQNTNYSYQEYINEYNQNLNPTQINTTQYDNYCGNQYYGNGNNQYSTMQYYDNQSYQNADTTQNNCVSYGSSFVTANTGLPNTNYSVEKSGYHVDPNYQQNYEYSQELGNYNNYGQNNQYAEWNQKGDVAMTNNTRQYVPQNTYYYPQNQQKSSNSERIPTEYQNSFHNQNTYQNPNNSIQNLDNYPQKPYSRCEMQELSAKNQSEHYVKSNEKANAYNPIKPLYNSRNYAANESSTTCTTNSRFFSSMSLQKNCSEPSIQSDSYDVEDDLKVALTGDPAIDEEILSFYRARYAVNQKQSTAEI